MSLPAGNEFFKRIESWSAKFPIPRALDFNPGKFAASKHKRRRASTSSLQRERSARAGQQIISKLRERIAFSLRGCGTPGDCPPLDRRSRCIDIRCRCGRP